jgi:hypothetical protein
MTPDADAALRRIDKGDGELAAAVVLVNDVAFEVHPPFRRADGVEPGGVVLARVAQQLNRVTLNQRRARRA